MSNWLSVIGKVAPAVATVLGGPFAGLAVEAVGSIFGMKDATKDKIQDAIEKGQLTGEQILALKQAELQLKAQLAEHGIKLEELEVEDRDSARKLQIATHSYWPGVLSAITTLAVLAVIGARMLNFALPQDPTTVQLIGSLTTGWGMALSYWFGTTRSSADKNNLLAQTQAQ